MMDYTYPLHTGNVNEKMRLNSTLPEHAKGMSYGFVPLFVFTTLRIPRSSPGMTYRPVLMRESIVARSLILLPFYGHVLGFGAEKFVQAFVTDSMRNVRPMYVGITPCTHRDQFRNSNLIHI